MNLDPLTIVWTVSSLIGLLVYTSLLGGARTDFRLIHRTAHTEGRHIVGVEQLITVSGMWLVELIFLIIGLAGIATLPMPPLPTGDINYVQIAVTIGFLTAQAILIAVGFVRRRTRQRLIEIVILEHPIGK